VSQAFSEVFPSATPAFDLKSLLTKSVQTAGPQFPTPTFYLPEISASIAPVASLTSTPALETPTPLVSPTFTFQLTETVELLEPASSACIPAGERRTGKVVEVLDGNTVRVLLDKDGLVYVIRYIGISAPEDKLFVELARQKNIEIVYGQEVILAPDQVDKDDRGRLLRYVLTENTFVNLEMVQQGFGMASDIPSESACAQAFKQAEQAARSALSGVWSPTVTPNSP
jgi:endonuclease YncB( thermonuclease family)